MAKFNSALHPRDAYGRWRSKGRKKKAGRLERKNKRVRRQLNEDYRTGMVAKNTPFAQSIERSIASRQVKIADLRGKRV